MSYDQLRAEYLRDGIGVLIWDLLQQVASRVARTYRTDVYNDGEPWTEESITLVSLDLAEALLANGRDQLRYVFRTADEDADDHLGTLQALLATKVKHTLRGRRHKTPIDRLMTRIQALVAEPPYSTLVIGHDVTVVVEADLEPAGQLSDREIRRGAASIDDIPRINTRVNAQRESKIYNGPHLDEVVARLVRAFEPVRLADIRAILESLLTAWVPTLLESDEEDHALSSTPETELIRNQMLTEIDSFAASLEPVHRLVLVGKSQNISDGKLAERAGISRPTLIKRREDVYRRVEEDVLAALPTELHDEAMRAILHACGETDEVVG